jgi:hypothetical protein
MLERRFSGGDRIGTRPTLAESREQFLERLAKLEQRYKDLERPDSYPVRHTAALNAMVINERVRAEKRQD